MNCFEQVEGMPLPRIVHCTSVHKWDDIRIFHKMCVSLARAGYDTHLIAIDRSASEDVSLSQQGVTVHLLHGSKIRTRGERFLLGGGRVFAKSRDLCGRILHFHDPELIPFMMRGVSYGARVIYDAHENLPGAVHSKAWIPGPIKPAMSLLGHSLETAASLAFDGVIGATPSIAERFPEKKRAVIQNFPIKGELAPAVGVVDIDAWRGRKNRGIYVGGISIPRGILPLLDGVAKSRKLEGFDLVGPWESDDVLERAKRSPGWDKVTYHGIVPRNRLPGLFCQARFGAVTFLPHPNHVEAQPNKLFEYLSAGLPVLASDYPLWRELLGEAVAEYVDPEDGTSIGNGIDRMLSPDDAAQARRCELALAETETKFNWEEEFEKLREFYARILFS